MIDYGIEKRFSFNQDDQLQLESRGDFDGDLPPVEASDNFCWCCARNEHEEIIGEQELLDEGKEIKELFPLLVKEIALNGDEESSLCPLFMKSRSLSVSYSQNGSLKKSITEPEPLYLLEKVKEEAKTEEVVNEPPIIEVNKVVNPSNEDTRDKKEDTEPTFSREKRNRKFTREEDEKLKSLVKIYGEGAWSKIAEEMKGRNRKQVRERYVNFLKKERVVSEFTPEEDAIIMQFVQTSGRKWSSIAEQLSGKTPIMIKNRYYAKLRKSTKTDDKGRHESSSLLTSSQADSSINGLATPSHDSTTKNGAARKESLENKESLERLKLQEENMKSALVELRKKIEVLRARMSKPTN